MWECWPILKMRSVTVFNPTNFLARCYFLVRALFKWEKIIGVFINKYTGRKLYIGYTAAKTAESFLILLFNYINKSVSSKELSLLSLALSHLRFKGSRCHELSDQNNTFLSFARPLPGVIEADYVRMLQTLQHPRLLFETLTLWLGQLAILHGTEEDNLSYIYTEIRKKFIHKQQHFTSLNYFLFTQHRDECFDECDCN